MKTVFFDVDTQIDFLYPAGALYAPGGEKIVDRIAALNRHAASHAIPVISTVDAHAEDDPEFATWPSHCVPGTAGQQKPAATLLDNRIVIRNAPSPWVLDGARQILLEKQTLDCFQQVNLEKLLQELDAERFVVYGVVTEVCVKFAALGLLKTGARVELVEDATSPFDKQGGARTVEEFARLGGVLTTVAGVIDSAND